MHIALEGKARSEEDGQPLQSESPPINLNLHREGQVLHLLMMTIGLRRRGWEEGAR